MATVLSSFGTIKNGSFITVNNDNRKAFSNQKYNYTAIWLEDAKGNNDKCYLFTGKEIIKIINRVEYTTLDLVPGRLNLIKTSKGVKKYLVRLLNTKDEDVFAIITEKELITAAKRAERNPEDLTKKSLFRSIVE